MFMFYSSFGRTSFPSKKSLADVLHVLLVIQRDPLRIFYETLHKQLPNSEMAQFW